MKGVNRMAQPDFEVIEFENEENDPSINLKPVIPINLKPLQNEELEIENKEHNISNGSLRSETVTILPAPLSQKILSRLERQSNKYWHFKFVKEVDFVNLEIKLLKEVGLTVQPNYGGKKHADITLFKDDQLVGKIHFLHANRPDICDPTTFYVKLHFYEFKDSLFEPVKKVMSDYFYSLNQSKHTSIRGGKKTRKRKRNERRKTRRS